MLQSVVPMVLVALVVALVPVWPWPRRKTYIQCRPMAAWMPPESVGKQLCLAQTSRKRG